MVKTLLEELRCQSCGKLLLKGSLGLGVIEVKCTRCDAINLFHSLDDLVRSRDKSYILVFDQESKIVATSKNVETILSYSQAELIGLPMQTINPLFVQPAPERLERYDVGGSKGGSLLGKQTYEITHTKKDGAKLAVTARYYPFGSFSGEHTMIILSLPR